GRDRRSCLGGRRSRATDGGDCSDLSALQIRHQSRKSISLALCPAVYNRHVLALDIAGLFETLPKIAQAIRERVRFRVEKPDDWHCRLLRPRRQRPRRRAAEQRDELTPPDHSITSSARASSDCGTSMPRDLAVFRLITSSYCVGACTGRSAGFSPLRIRSTYPAACRSCSARPAA